MRVIIPPINKVKGNEKWSAKRPANGPPIIPPIAINSELMDVIVALLLLGISS